MYTLVIYDITDDEVRMKIAEACREVGLVRIQKSAFLGTINSQQRKNLEIRLRKVLGPSKGNIQIFVICEADISNRRIVGETIEYDEKEGVVFL